MALTSEQDLPSKPQPKQEGWTSRALFPARATVNAIVKVFVSPLELLLAWSFLIIGVAILCERDIPNLFYALVFALILGTILERLKRDTIVGTDKEKK